MTSLGHMGVYRLVRRIGVGGMAEVFEAEREGPHGTRLRVALKRMLPAISQRSFEQQRRWFEREMQLCARLHTATIVRTIDYGIDDGHPFIAMQYVEGADLASLIKAVRAKNQTLGFATIAYIAHELCDALAYAHAQKVLHRDISPSNVLLSRWGEVKLSDFGIGKPFDLNKGLTIAGQIVGKVSYMSPEALQAKDLDVRSDIFSLGVTLVNAATEKPLFRSASIAEALQERASVDVTAFVRERTDLPWSFVQLLARMCGPLQERIDSADACQHIIGGMLPTATPQLNLMRQLASMSGHPPPRPPPMSPTQSLS